MRLLLCAVVSLLLITSTVCSAGADTTVLYYEGFLNPKKPKIVKQPRNSRAKCTVTGAAFISFRLDPLKKGLKVSMGDGISMRGKLKGGALKASTKQAGLSYLLEVKDIRKSATKVTWTLTRNWGGGLTCAYPFSATLARTQFVVAQ